MKERRQMTVRPGWQREEDGGGTLANRGPVRVPGSLQTLRQCMDGSFIYSTDLCLAFTMCQVL